MGKNNRARRAAKAKARKHPRGASASSSTPHGGFRSGHASSTRPRVDGEPLFTPAEVARNALWLAARAQHLGDPLATDFLAKLRRLPPDLVDREAEALILTQVDLIWAGGWQPAELNRQGRLGCATVAGARLVSLAIATDHVGRRSVTLHPRWVAQVEGLGLPRVDGRAGWIGRWIIDECLERPQAIATVVDTLANLLYLQRLDPLLPPPGSADSTQGAQGAASIGGAVGADTNPVLERIRNLLAKAESTTFEAEAMAFTAKAQELMTRHAIDAALLQASARSDDRPAAIRVPIDAPYADAKSLLLQTVAEASRCRAVFHTQVSLSTVVGYPSDVAAVELLFTSLLVQAQTAMADAAKRAPAGSRHRSQSFRSAFLVAFTHRIGTRLGEINDAVYAEVESAQGSAFLPVLRSRSAAVDDFITDRFGELASSSVRRGYDSAGWASGIVAADNAQLAFAEFAEP